MIIVYIVNMHVQNYYVREYKIFNNHLSLYYSVSMHAFNLHRDYQIKHYVSLRL